MYDNESTPPGEHLDKIKNTESASDPSVNTPPPSGHEDNNPSSSVETDFWSKRLGRRLNSEERFEIERRVIGLFEILRTRMRIKEDL